MTPEATDPTAGEETPRLWPENAWPTIAELADWLSRCTSRERMEFAAKSLTTAQQAAVCIDHDHEGQIARESAAAKPYRGPGDFWTQAEWAEWSNRLAALLPEEYDGDTAQEALIERALADLAATATRARAEALREAADETRESFEAGDETTWHAVGDWLTLCADALAPDTADYREEWRP